MGLATKEKIKEYEGWVTDEILMSFVGKLELYRTTGIVTWDTSTFCDKNGNKLKSYNEDRVRVYYKDKDGNDIIYTTEEDVYNEETKRFEKQTVEFKREVIRPPKLMTLIPFIEAIERDLSHFRNGLPATGEVSKETYNLISELKTEED